MCLVGTSLTGGAARDRLNALLLEERQAEARDLREVPGGR